MSNSSLESEGQVADFAVRFSAASEAGLVPRLASENSLFYRVHALGASSTGFGSHFSTLLNTRPKGESEGLETQLLFLHGTFLLTGHFFRLNDTRKTLPSNSWPSSWAMACDSE